VIRRLAAASAALLIFSELCACSHGNAVACEPTSRYAAASTAGPVRIPDDLNPPDETDSLRLPPDTGRTAPPSKACLETPPGFYADGAPANPRGTQGQRRTGAPAPGPRQAAPPPAAAPAPTSAPIPAESQPPAAATPTPPAAAPAPPAVDAPPPGGDREITN
jgi:translation initiation factor IF-2